MTEVRISFATEAGSDTTPNEDAIAATSQVVAVVDGVSAPKSLSTGCIHGTPWYAKSLASELVATLSRESGLDLRSALRTALKTVADSHADTCDLASDGTPSGTVAIIRERQDFLDYLILSDAVIALETISGVEVVTDKRVDRVVGDLVREAQAAPLGSKEREMRIARLITEQRKLRNIEGGYWLAGAVPEAANHAIVGSIQCNHVYSAAAMTDGAASLVDVYHAMPWEDAIKEFTASSPYGWIKRVREIESADNRAIRWPRFKASDDATIALCVLNP